MSKLKSSRSSTPSWNRAGTQLQVEIAQQLNSKFKSHRNSTPSWNGAGFQPQVTWSWRTARFQLGHTLLLIKEMKSSPDLKINNELLYNYL